METLVRVLIGVGVLVAIAGGIHQLAAIFRFSPTWGWVSFVVPFAGWIFLLKHGHLITKGFYISIGGICLIALGFVCHSYFL